MAFNLKTRIWQTGALDWWAMLDNEDVYLGSREFPLPPEEGAEWHVKKTGVLFKIVDGEIEPGPHLAIGILRETYRARRGDPLEPRGDVHTVTHKIAVTLLDDVSQMDTDAELNAAFRGQAGIALDHRRLHFDGTAHSVNHAPELDERTITGPLYHASPVHSDGRIDQIAAQRPEPRQSAVFIGSGKPAEADHIRRQDRS